VELTGLKAESGAGVDLRKARLRGVRLRGAKLARLDLRGADLRGSSLGMADLRGTLLDEADLREADFAGADLRGASLAEADLRGAMLEDADFRRAGLRFAKLEGAALEGANLRGADLWGASAPDADFAGSDLRGATLREADLSRADLSGADLRGAALGQAALAGAKLRGADLRRASIQGATLDDADLGDARLQGLDLTVCSLARVKLCDAWLEKARLRCEQLGGAVGEEVAGQHDRARKAYLGLERMFEAMGDPDAASWAYRRKRRMQKLDALHRGRAALASGDRRGAASGYAAFAGDQVVEWICDYGESIPRILATMLLVYLSFTALYGLTGAVVRVEGGNRVVTRSPFDLAVYSLLAIATPGNPPVGLAPRSVAVQFLGGLQALIGIGLTGLLGFVAGNRMRR
jgi:uncharacterized protein YjbI with pentapeptide repeats